MTITPGFVTDCQLTARFFASISHMFSASILQDSSCPQCAAACSGVQPSVSLAFISKPACSNTLQHTVIAHQ